MLAGGGRRTRTRRTPGVAYQPNADCNKTSSGSGATAPLSEHPTSNAFSVHRTRNFPTIDPPYLTRIFRL